jgi:Winged helix DNA-binding domain
LNARALNRSLLARQGLLSPWPVSAGEALERLVGMQSQVPNAPYVGLFSRVAGFVPDDLARLVESRAVVRTSLMRSTLHSVTARDCLRLWPVMAVAAARGFAASPFARRVTDAGDAVAYGRELLAERPRTLAELRRAFAARWPTCDAEALAYAVRYLVPMVQLPPRGVWGRSKQATWAAVADFLGAEPAGDADPADALRRYVAAFGPASPADMRAWSGLTGVRPPAGLVEAGGLLDLPDAPRPDPATPAPPRFLPEYDNVLVAHADRSRILPPPFRDTVLHNLGRTWLLVDGFVAAEWRRAGDDLAIAPLRPLSRGERDAVIDEGRRLLAFLGAGGDVAIETRPAGSA